MELKSFISTQERIDALARLGDTLAAATPHNENIFQHAYAKNNWFTRDNIELAIRTISNAFLNKEKLTAFAQQYDLFHRSIAPKNIGLVFAGNIPLVGFHDWLCVMLTGHNALVKLSSKDDVLFPYILQLLFADEPRLAANTKITEQLKGFDAVIATGSNNSARYFDYYFGKYPHIIRRNRSSVAVIDEHTTPEQLQALADDVFMFFGLGCRNVSKLFIHQAVNVNYVLKHFDKYAGVANHNKYRNNFDYRLTLAIMNNQPYHSNDYLLAVQDPSLSSPLAVIHYERYNDIEQLKQRLAAEKENIQVIVGNNFTPFGSSQNPSLTDYADGVDTIRFLLSL